MKILDMIQTSVLEEKKEKHNYLSDCWKMFAYSTVRPLRPSLLQLPLGIPWIPTHSGDAWGSLLLPFLSLEHSTALSTPQLTSMCLLYLSSKVTSSKSLPSSLQTRSRALLHRHPVSFLLNFTELVGVALIKACLWATQKTLQGQELCTPCPIYPCSA